MNSHRIMKQKDNYIHSNYQIYKTWSDLFVDEAELIIDHFIKPTLGKVIISTPKMDREEGFDFLLQSFRSRKKISCRVRDDTIRFRDFTIRSRVKSNNITELDKILNGAKIDFYLYMWGNDQLNKITDFIIIDFKKLKEKKDWKRFLSRRKEVDNRDGTGFVSIKLWELRKRNCLLFDSTMDPNLLNLLYLLNSMNP